jgi:hypothetical protein
LKKYVDWPGGMANREDRQRGSPCRDGFIAQSGRQWR